MSRHWQKKTNIYSFNCFSPNHRFTQHTLVYSDSSSSQVHHQFFPSSYNSLSFHYLLCLCHKPFFTALRASCCSQRLPLTLATTKPCQFTLTIASPSVTVSSSHSGLNTAHVIILYVQNALLLSFKLDCQICSFFPFTIISNVTSLKRQSLHSLRKPPAEYTPQVESKDRFPWVLQHTPMTIPAPNPTGYHFWIL